VKVLISPHNDDAALFAAFTCLRESPLVIVVFDGYIQAARGNAVTAEQRRLEDQSAMEILGCRLAFCGLRDDQPANADQIMAAIRLACPDVHLADLWVPAYESGGHPQHNAVAQACAPIASANSYATYANGIKTTTDRPVPIVYGGWIAKKLRAIACYESQMSPALGCQAHFLGAQYEYYL
jgi:LmbE family N-acetylglucosaminyl deacetylase